MVSIENQWYGALRNSTQKPMQKKHGLEKSC